MYNVDACKHVLTLKWLHSYFPASLARLHKRAGLARYPSIVGLPTTDLAKVGEDGDTDVSDL